MNLLKEVSEENRLLLLKDYFQTSGLVKHQLETFDHFIFHDIKTIIDDEASIIFNGKRSLSSQIKNGAVEEGYNRKESEKIMLKFENVFVAKPTITNDDTTVRPLYPAEARQKMITYDSFVFVDVLEYVYVMKRNIGKQTFESSDSQIPIMLRCSTCNLYNCTPQERIELGEGY